MQAEQGGDNLTTATNGNGTWFKVAMVVFAALITILGWMHIGALARIDENSQAIDTLQAKTYVYDGEIRERLAVVETTLHIQTEAIKMMTDQLEKLNDKITECNCN